MKRLRPASRQSFLGQSFDEGKKEMRPMSEIFKTSAVPISIGGISDGSGSFKGSLVNLIDGQIREDSSIQFNEECTQFMMEKKAVADGADILDIAILDDSKFRETRLIARRRINIDQLLGPTSGSTEQLVSLTSDPNIQTTTKLQPNRPVEFVFRLKNANLQTSREISSGLSYRFSPNQCSSERLTVRDRPSTDSGSISIKMRLHLQLFQSENNC